MNLWIVTTGSSDVQLIDDEDLDWNGWWYNIKNSIYKLPFKPVRAIDEDGEPYRLPARVLSIAYNQSPDQVKPYLTFPLLKNFSDKLKEKNVNIDRIIVLVSDQTDIFPEEVRETVRCPYWQDTCELYPIVESYLREQFPKSMIQPLSLKPETSKKGLDDWDAVLDLVGKGIKDLTFDAEPETVFVSHQAGTPAISSAVQFCSLAKFGDRVKFLVSNEQDATLTDIVKSSAYLQGIKREQAKKLLDHYDYLGVQDLLIEYLEDDIKTLLESAIQWNFAHFAEGYNLIKNNKLVKKGDRRSFIEILGQNPDFSDLVAKRIESDKWWWAAYEAAYLSFIRLDQGNTVEAVFHSFRSVEWALKFWAEKKYPGELVNTKHPRHQENSRWDRNLRLYGEDLYTFLDMKRTIDKTNDSDFDMWVFGNVVIKRRNDLFHNIKGLNDQENVFEAWRSPNEPQWKGKAEETWKSRVLNCLNFIVREDFPEGFKLEEASLMVKVHEKLKEAIASL